MSMNPMYRHGAMGTAVAAALAIALAATPAAPASARPHAPMKATKAAMPTVSTGGSAVAVAPGSAITLSTGRGQMIVLPRAMSDLFVADPAIADVQVRSPTRLYVFGKATGETTLSATARDGSVVFSAAIRVGPNIGNIGQMLKIAMPDAQITATPMNGMVILTGTVAAPDDVEEANRLVTAFVGKDVQVVSRLKTATPLQVMLKVRFAEVSRSFEKSIGFNILTSDPTGGFKFGIGQGQAIDPDTLKTAIPATGSVLNFAGPLAGLNIISALDLAENDGLATTLAQPTLTALSGETASFLAGGEIPIPVPQYQGVTTIEYKQYGVSLAFTPTVLGDGRISMRVRPEVSQLDKANGVTIGSISVPGILTRRTETTVELGSGQAFVIGGLLNNNVTNNVNKAPFLGDLPVIGQLFRSNGWKRDEDELVIVVTPYLVKPVSDNRIVLPTDGYRMANDAQIIALDQQADGKSGKKGKYPKALPPVTAPATDPSRKDQAGTPAPGFSLN